jgi:DNA-binding GntR family transcriptional regulator
MQSHQDLNMMPMRSVMTKKATKAVPIYADATAAKRGSRAAGVYRALRRAIIEQAVRPGQKLPEDAIGRQFGVSRTLVREAIGRLTVEGLVEVRHNRGACVAYPSLDEARAVFDVRRALERMVVEMLAGRLISTQAAALTKHVDQEEAAASDGPRSIRLAGEFHILLAEMTGNDLLLRYVKEVSSRCSLILALYGRPHSSECAVNEHRRLIDCLGAGDAKTAVRLMEQHLKAVASRALLTSSQPRNIQAALAPYAHQERHRTE